MHSLIIFASGKGTNAAAIIDYFKQNRIAKVSLIVSNKAEAGVLDIARTENIPHLLIDKQSFSSKEVLAQLKEHKPSLIILAGFLWKIPDNLIEAFRHRVINIHPALLPDHGGKGMYGNNVHQAVISAGKKESGITIHYVDEVYDNGDTIVQARCVVKPEDTPETLAQRIHKLEHFFFPRTIEFLLTKGSLHTN
jgi:phosphoribosylglycinamide formyltransferase-1